jgi:hypothetical protein
MAETCNEKTFSFLFILILTNSDKLRYTIDSVLKEILSTQLSRVTVEVRRPDHAYTPTYDLLIPVLRPWQETRTDVRERPWCVISCVAVAVLFRVMCDCHGKGGRSQDM